MNPSSPCAIGHSIPSDSVGSIKVCHVINWLNVGGAEMMLVRLLERSDRRKFRHEVVSLMDLGPLAGRIRALGVPLSALGMSKGVPNPIALWRLAGLLRRTRPDIVQTWLYQSDLLGGLAAKLSGCKNVIWGIHLSAMDPKTTKWLSRLTARTCALFSKWLPARIVCCSDVAAKAQFQIGYDSGKFVTIPNGFDLSEFQALPQLREEVRKELNLGPECVLIGMFARFHPQKDHGGFFEAVRLIASRRPLARFLLCGQGVAPETEFFANKLKNLPCADRVSLLGRRSDVPRLLQALDVATLSSSHGEAFPLFLGESMASSVPCVSTDVGDSAMLVADTGLIVPPRDPVALAGAWEKLIDLGPDGRAKLGRAAREQIAAKFELGDVVSRYEKLYIETLRGQDGFGPSFESGESAGPGHRNGGA